MLAVYTYNLDGHTCAHEVLDLLAFELLTANDVSSRLRRRRSRRGIVQLQRFFGKESLKQSLRASLTTDGHVCD
jgi:hypothetical protein